MALRLRFLLDTNVLIPLQDSYQVLEENLKDFVRLANVGGHQLLYHPATIKDFHRDTKDIQRQQRNLARLDQYIKLDSPAPCPWNLTESGSNDACDNEILYALECDAIHALVTEDKGIHAKARAKGLQDRVYTIQMAQYWLRSLHETEQVILPNIEDVPLHSLTPILSTSFFDSLRAGYPATDDRSGFDEWFRTKAKEGRRAWVYRDDQDNLAALCVYTEQKGEILNDAKERLNGMALKICTFKVGEQVRGRKIGELFLKAAFAHATKASCENVFTHANMDEHTHLMRLLDDFGFKERGTYGGDVVLVKSHPIHPPEPNGISALDYAKHYFPHFRDDSSVGKFLVPIIPKYHDILFPDYSTQQGRLFSSQSSAGNAIKLAYLCHTQMKTINLGDILLFYRTKDEMALTTIGIVDRFEILEDPAQIASLVSRRTVYSHQDIETMAKTPVKVILFRSIKHLSRSVSYKQLQKDCGIAGPFQTIRRVQDDQFAKILAAGR